MSAFSFLFSEMVQYFQGRVQNISDLENRCGVIVLLSIPTYIK